MNINTIIVAAVGYNNDFPRLGVYHDVTVSYPTVLPSVTVN